MQTIEELNNDIDNTIKDAPARNITAGALRGILKKVTTFLNDLAANRLSAWFKVGAGTPSLNATDDVYHTGKVIVGRSTDNGSGANLQAREASFDTINGQAAGPITVIPQPGDGSTPIRYYLVCTLPAPNFGTFDYVQIEVVAKPWDNSAGGHYLIDFFGSNRSTFFGEYTTQGNYRPVVGLVAYWQPNGQVNIYVKSDNNYQAVVYQVKRHIQATVFTSPIAIDTAPGILVYDTTDPSTYVPMAAIKQRWSLFKSGNTDNSLPEMAPNTVGESQLAIGANQSGGRSELTLLNNNLAGGGFSLVQRLTATTKKLLAYFSRNGELVLGGESTTPVELLTVNGNQYLAGYLKQAQIIARRKIILYEGSNNDYQFYGFGVIAGTMLYNVNSVADKHVFVAGSSPATSVVLGAITGDKRLGVGTDVPGFPLDVFGDNPTSGVVAEFANVHGASGANGAFIQIHQGGISIWRMGLAVGVNAFVIQGWQDGSTFPEFVRITADGRFLIGTPTANAVDKLLVNGSISGKFHTMAANPSASDIADGSWRIIKNTSNNEVRMWINNGGTVKSVLFS